MNVQLVFLWTDILLAILLLSVAAILYCGRGYQPLIQPLAKIMRSKRAVLSLIVLSLYSGIAILDSIHYRELLPETVAGVKQYDNTIKSVLDDLIAPLGQFHEKTYSAPLAIIGYSKENIEQADGTVLRDFPRLIHAAKGITNDTEKWQDISQRLQSGAAKASLFALIFIIAPLFIFSVYRKNHCDKKMLLLIGVTLTVLVLMISLIVALAPHYYILGTDKIGSDVLYQAIKSIRTGLIIGTLTTLIMLPFALALGTLAGFFGGVVDDVIQYIYTTLSSIPGVLLIAAAILMLQLNMSKYPDLFESISQRADARLLALCLILGLTSWTSLCRLMRAETIKLRELDYVQAARALGVSRLRIIWRHILPNVLHIVFIVIALDFSGLVLAEAVLSYVGVGVDPSAHSWGNMINQARLELAREPAVWWSLLASFSFMFILVLFANLFADAVRDAFDPRVAER